MSGEQEVDIKNKLLTVALLAALALALGLRVWRFDAIEPMTSDEAMYLRQARFMYTVAGLALGAEMPVVDASKQGLWRHARRADWDDKPCWLHSALIAAWMPLTGVTTAAGTLHNLLFSMGAVILAYFTGRSLYGKAGAVFAATLLGVSFYWMIYSRGHWAEADATFFVLLAFFVVVTRFPRESYGLLAGFAAGAAAATGGLCHYRFLTAALPLGLAAIAVSDRQTLVAKVAMLGAGFAAVLLAFEGAMRLGVSIAKPDIPFNGYLTTIREFYFPGGGSVRSQTQVGPLNVLAFLYYLLRNQGVAAAALTLLGLLPFAWPEGEKRQYCALLGFLLIPLVLLSFQIWIVARAMSVAIPFVCLLAGRGMDFIAERAWTDEGRPHFVPLALAAALAVAALVENVPRDVRFARNAMGHRRVAEALAEAKPPRIYVDPESVHLYAWHKPDLPYVSDRTLRADLGSTNSFAGAWAIFDAEKYHAYPERWEPLGALEASVRTRGKLVQEQANMSTAWPEFLLDGTQAHNLFDMLDSLRLARESDITSIRVYRMDR